MDNKISEGKTFRHTAGGDIASGSVLLQGNTLGISVKKLESGETGAFETEGVFECAKLSTDDIGLGDQVYWDDGNSRFTTTASTHKGKGIAYEAAGNGVTTVKVKINKSM